MTFELSLDEKPVAAPTLPLAEDPRRGRSLSGEVHDNYAAALGGVAGHAGLFGSGAALGAFARVVLRAARGDARLPDRCRRRSDRASSRSAAVPGSSRALGWDTMLPTSSCGTRMSAAAFGHVGFTGTSLWIDPARSLFRAADQPRLWGRHARPDARRPPRVSRLAGGSLTPDKSLQSGIGLSLWGSDCSASAGPLAEAGRGCGLTGRPPVVN